MEAKHTPGPWFVANGNKIHDRETAFGKSGERIVNTANEIAMTFYDQTERGTKEANARLIAAAPELLEALEMAYAHIQTKLYLIRDADKETISSAIAKAKGEKQCGK